MSNVAESFDSVGASEAAAVRNLAYYMEDEAKDLRKEQMSDLDDELVVETFNKYGRRTWPLFIDALIRRFLNDEVLQ